jgi:hypothetical protein
MLGQVKNRYFVIILLWNIFIASSAASDISKKVSSDDTNPTKNLAQTLSSIFSITLQDYFIASRWNQSGSANLVQFRTLMPFQAWGRKNLLRLNIPFRTASELGPGLGDVQFFDLLLFETRSGFWGVGPVFNLGVNKGPGIDTLQVGPAVGFIISSNRAFSFGFLNQNLFSDQIGLSTVQPIFVYQPGAMWTVGLGELPIVYNWKSNQISVFSIGIQLGFLLEVAEQPVRFFLNPQFNTKNNTKLYQWTVATGITLPLQGVK